LSHEDAPFLSAGQIAPKIEADAVLWSRGVKAKGDDAVASESIHHLRR
jgi:hypothetical protein